MSHGQVQSPCIGICQLIENSAGDAICRGCLRTVSEIAGWSSMSESDKQRVLDRLKQLEQTTELESKQS